MFAETSPTIILCIIHYEKRSILSIGTGIAEHADYAKDFIETCKYIKANLPYAHILGGVSNLSFAFKGNNAIRESMHSCFLYHATKAGMDFGIVNAGSLPIYDDILAEEKNLIEDLIFNRNPDATDKLLQYAESIKERKSEVSHASSAQTAKAGKILMATVKGDVHDIGKNIVSLVLACNNYEIIDLGVMCPAEKILEAVKKHSPNLLGLSGLITPSLSEMSFVVETLSKENLDYGHIKKM